MTSYVDRVRQDMHDPISDLWSLWQSEVCQCDQGLTPRGFNVVDWTYDVTEIYMECHTCGAERVVNFDGDNDYRKPRLVNPPTFD